MNFSAEMTKSLFADYPDKEALRLFIRSLTVLSEKERVLLEMRYCDKLPLKCFEMRYNCSERWAKTLSKRTLDKASPFVYAAIVKGLASSL